MVPGERVELSLPCGNWILSPARLPISPPRQMYYAQSVTSVGDLTNSLAITVILPLIYFENRCGPSSQMTGKGINCIPLFGLICVTLSISISRKHGLLYSQAVILGSDINSFAVFSFPQIGTRLI